MKAIRDLKSVQIRIFPVDDIPINSLRRTTAIESIKLRYKFDFTRFPEPIPFESQNLIFTNGEFQFEKQKCLIDRLVIEDRRIIINGSSSSKVIDAFYKDLCEQFKKLDLRSPKPKYVPLVKTDETTCIVKLNISFQSLFKGSKVLTISKDLLKSTPCYDCELAVYPSSLKFKISYLKVPESIVQHKISLAEKFFVLEVRERTTPDEQFFFTSSPTDTDTHLSLIKTIESRFADD